MHKAQEGPGFSAPATLYQGGRYASQELGSLATLYPLLPSCQDLCLSNLSLSPVAEFPCREIGKAAEGSDVRAAWSK